MTLVSLPVEYEIDGTKQSTLFFIYKNADGSIVWLTDKPKTQPQDLAAMHRQIALLDTARKDLPASGVVNPFYLRLGCRGVPLLERQILLRGSMIIRSICGINR